MSEAVAPRAPDMGNFVGFLQARRAEIQNPKHIGMLDLLIEHSVAEVRDHDIDRTMVTLVEDCVYHNYGDQAAIKQFGGHRVAHRDAVRNNYLAGMENGTLRMENIEVDVEHFLISDDCIAWDGFTYLRLPGSVLAQAGASLPDGGTAADDYLQSTRMAIFIPFRDGLMVGEDFYIDGEPTLEKLN